MTDDFNPTKRDDALSQKRNLLTPELRDEFVRLRDQMGEFAGRLLDLCDSLQVINNAIFNAQEIAECLIYDDLLGACEVIKRQQPSEVPTKSRLSWNEDLDLDNEHFGPTGFKKS